MTNLCPVRLCIMGPGGVGKSPLAKLFKLESWEPFRVREPRSPEDAKVCMSPAMSQDLEVEHQHKTPLYPGKSIRVYDDWSRLEVRDKVQWLEHTKAAKNANASLRMEVFAPVFLEMVKNRAKLRSAFALDLDSLLVVLLNPTSCSYGDMDEPSIELRLATVLATAERARLQGNEVDIAECLRRSEGIGEELAAWKAFLTDKELATNTVECLKWPHFETTYFSSDKGMERAQLALLSARWTLLRQLRRHSSDTYSGVLEVMRTPDEIASLTDII